MNRQLAEQIFRTVHQTREQRRGKAGNDADAQRHDQLICEIVVSIGIDENVELLEVRQSHCSGDFSHFAVGPGIDHVVVTSESEIAD